MGIQDQRGTKTFCITCPPESRWTRANFDFDYKMLSREPLNATPCVATICLQNFDWRRIPGVLGSPKASQTRGEGIYGRLQDTLVSLEPCKTRIAFLNRKRTGFLFPTARVNSGLRAHLFWKRKCILFLSDRHWNVPEASTWSRVRLASKTSRSTQGCRFFQRCSYLYAGRAANGEIICIAFVLGARWLQYVKQMLCSELSGHIS